MKKAYKLRGLDCANCAVKMENAIAKLPGIISVSVSFFTQRMTLTLADGADEAAVLEKIKKVIHRVEPDCEVVA